MANYKIDKSLLDEAEQAEWDRLVAKAKVDPEAAEEEMKDEKPEVPAKKKTTEKAEVENMEDTKKSAPEVQKADPTLTAALEELAELKKSFAMNEMVQVAKKYAPLGKKEEDLAKTLYEMKKSNPANYDAYVAILDESLALVEKSGMFAEIGKSSGGATNGDYVAKAEAKAAEIMKADPNIDYDTAIAKAYEDPAIMAECDAAYYGN